MTHYLLRPSCGLISVTRGAWVRNFVFVRHHGGNEPEGVGADEGVGHAFRLNRRHVARYALASGAAVFVMRVFFKRGGSRAVGRRRTMTIQAKLVARLAKLRVVPRAVRVVTIKASNSTPVHHALHEVIALHSVLVRGPIREIIKVRRFAEGVIL